MFRYLKKNMRWMTVNLYHHLLVSLLHKPINHYLINSYKLSQNTGKLFTWQLPSFGMLNLKCDMKNVLSHIYIYIYIYIYIRHFRLAPPWCLIARLLGVGRCNYRGVCYFYRHDVYCYILSLLPYEGQQTWYEDADNHYRRLLVLLGLVYSIFRGNRTCTDL